MQSADHWSHNDPIKLAARAARSLSVLLVCYDGVCSHTAADYRSLLVHTLLTALEMILGFKMYEMTESCICELYSLLSANTVIFKMRNTLLIPEFGTFLKLKTKLNRENGERLK